jgi:hypothetical protein
MLQQIGDRPRLSGNGKPAQSGYEQGGCERWKSEPEIYRSTTSGATEAGSFDKRAQ